MSSGKITQNEADKLLSMLKSSLVSQIIFPELGGKEKFNVIGDTKKDIFDIEIYRGKINALKYNMGAHIKQNGIMLLELHINPSSVHINPNGERIKGNHWHIYTEKYGRQQAFSAENILSDKFKENAMEFLIKFNVVKQPEIKYQTEMILG